MENDGDESKAAAQDGQTITAATATTSAPAAHEEGFVLAVDDTFATDLDVAPSGGKSPPKKQESPSSKSKSEGKVLAKPQSSSSSQSTRARVKAMETAPPLPPVALPQAAQAPSQGVWKVIVLNIIWGCLVFKVCILLDLTSALLL